MLKRILLLGILFISFISIGYSAEYNVTTCGTDTIVSDNDVVNINLSNNFQTYIGNCVIISNSAEVFNVTINFLNENIFFNSNGNIDVIRLTDNRYNNLVVQGTKIDFSASANGQIIGDSTLNGVGIINSQFNNFTIKNALAMYRCYRSLGFAIFSDNQFNNLIMYDSEYFMYEANNCREIWERNNVSDSFLYLNQAMFPNSVTSYSNNDWTYDNVVGNIYNMTGIDFTDGLNAIDSKDLIVHQYTDQDLNDDNLGDNFPERVMSTEIFFSHLNKTIEFYQDTEEGQPFLPSTADAISIVNSNPVISFPNANIEIQQFVSQEQSLWILPTGFYDGNPFEYPAISSQLGIRAGTNNIIERAFPSLEGLFTLPTNAELQFIGTSSSGTPEKGYIRISSGAEIDLSNLIFQVTNTGAGSSIISNADTSIYYPSIDIHGTKGSNTRDGQILISSAYFNSADEELIQLWTQDSKLTNLDLSISPSINPAVELELFKIDDTGAKGSRVQTNYFDAGGNNHYVFSEANNVKFCNNVLLNGMELTNIPSQNIALNCTFIHVEGNTAYEFNIGNYWQSNTNCTDGNSDGICDSPYTINGYVDNYPLASQTYDFQNNLLTAIDSYSINSDINISAIYPTDGSTINVTSSSSTLNILYEQNSPYDDVICYLYVNGLIIDSRLAPPNTQISIPTTGYQEQIYNYQVICENDFQESSSGVITFTINYGEPSQPPNGGDNGGDNGGIVNGSIDNIDFFSADISQSGNNLVDMFKTLNPVLSVLLVIGFMVLFLAIISLIFGVIMFGIKRAFK